MIDIDKIEAAAKAAGYDMQHSISAMYPYPDQLHVNNKQWNPLANDGDALRQALEVLGLIGGEDEPHHDDKIKAIAAIKGILNETS